MHDFGDWCRSMGIRNPIVNPLAQKTKGECLEQCRNQALLRESALDSVSCGKRGRHQYWLNKEARSCGYCIPCLFRRAALQRIGLDNGEDYGVDVLDRTQLPLFAGKKMSEDYADLLSLLSRHLSLNQITDEIQMNGLMSCDDLSWAPEVVQRSLEEVRAWVSINGDLS